MYSLWSTIYLEQDVDNYSCYVTEDIWLRLMNEYNTSRIFARIVKDDKYWLCSLGSPIRTNLVSENHTVPIFVPTWMLEQINCIGNGENIIIEWMPNYVFDHSTHIVLEPFDSSTTCNNIQELLSIELTKLAILQRDTNIYIKLNDLTVIYKVKDLHPASVVLCEGDEVGLEFVEQRPLTPYPFDHLPELLVPELVVPELLVPSAPPAEEPIQQPRFNPWRNKDFKPNTS